MSCEDLVLGDDDGVLFLPSPQAEEMVTLAEAISDTEQHQAKRIRAGVSLRSQVQFRAYLAKREKTPSSAFASIALSAVAGGLDPACPASRQAISEPGSEQHPWRALDSPVLLCDTTLGR